MESYDIGAENHGPTRPGAREESQPPPVHRIVVEAAPPRRRSVFWRIAWAVFIAFVVFAVLGNLFSLTQGGGPGPVLKEHYLQGSYDDPNRIAVIPLSGLIFEYDGMRHGPVEMVVEGLRKAAQDEQVKAVILEVNSPGGGITASDDLQKEIEDFKRSGKKVVVLMKDMATSGGYYVSAGADSIIAEPTTITGSVGVIVAAINYRGLADWIRVKQVTFKSGEVKDILSPMREMTQEEADLMQEIVDAMFARFREVVLAGRAGKMTQADFDRIADGRILTAEQAMELHLVDAVGRLDDAVKEAERLSGAPGAAVVRYWRKPGVLETLLAARSERSALPWEGASTGAATRGSWSPFLYMWPGPR